MEGLDPGRAAEAKAWLEKASKDLRGAQIDRHAVPPFLEDVLFHSQQAVEKSLKAYLSWNDQPFRKTHNLVELGEACGRLDRSLEPLLRKAAVLTEYAWKFRYPGDVEEAGKKEADEALGLAQRVYVEIKKRLPQETYPGPWPTGSQGPAVFESPAPYRAGKTGKRKMRKGLKR